MIIGDVFRQFPWRDRRGLTWDVYVFESPFSVDWCAVSRQNREHAKACLRVRDPRSQKRLQIARLVDVLVPNNLENRGTGSMLVSDAIEECKRRGHTGIDGDIIRSDQRSLNRLKHLYEKLGFSVEFFDTDNSVDGGRVVGKISMMF